MLDLIIADPFTSYKYCAFFKGYRRPFTFPFSLSTYIFIRKKLIMTIIKGSNSSEGYRVLRLDHESL